MKIIQKMSAIHLSRLYSYNYISQRYSISTKLIQMRHILMKRSLGAIHMKTIVRWSNHVWIISCVFHFNSLCGR